MRRMALFTAGLAASAIVLVLVTSLQTHEKRTGMGQLSLIEGAVAAEGGVPETVAADAARTQLSEMQPDVHGLRIADSRLAGALARVEDATGRIVHTNSDPRDAWVFQFDGPAQNGFAHVLALVIVDAQTGEVVSAQVLQTNE